MIDITPTVLDILDIKAPDKLDGIKQMDMHGANIFSSFNDPEAPSPRNTQFFSLRGNRAIFQDGWRAITIHKNGTEFNSDEWELYHIDKDFSEEIDIADKYPGKLKELQDLWWSEAGKYGALPLQEWHY